MKKIVGFTLLLVFTVSLSLATGTKPESKHPMKIRKRNAQPNVPGMLVIDFGFNLLQNDDPAIDTELLGSRTVNLYYMYDKQIGNSKFFVLPGIGFGLDRYKFSDDVTITPVFTGDEKLSAFDSIQGGGVAKSMFVTNYIDIPLEVRFYSNPKDTKRSFKVGLGFKVGYLFNAHTKVKQNVFGDDIKTKLHHDFRLNRFRYGVTGRVGVGGFNVFYYQSLNTLFRDGEGPLATEANNITFGISFTGF